MYDLTGAITLLHLRAQHSTQQVHARFTTVLYTPNLQATPAVATFQLWVAAGVHASCKGLSRSM